MCQWMHRSTGSSLDKWLWAPAAEIIAERAKLVAETNEHAMNIDGDPSLSDFEEDEGIIENNSTNL